MYTRIYEYIDMYVHVHTYVFVLFCIVDIATQTMHNQKKCLNTTHMDPTMRATGGSLKCKHENIDG